MADQFLGEIRIFGFGFAPLGWSTCAGQLLPVSQNAALFSLLGITYGGNGTSNFQLPDFQAQVPLHAGAGPGLTPRVQGEQVGENSVTLSLSELPNHNHALNAAGGDAGVGSPAGAFPAKGGEFENHKSVAYNTYVAATPATAMASGAIVSAGGSQPHENRQPTLAVNFCIALSGQFPARP